MNNFTTKIFFEPRFGENFVPKEEKIKDQSSKLSEAQQKIVDNVSKILENKETNKKVTESFKKNFEDTVHNPEMLSALFEQIKQKMQQELSDILKNFNNKKIDDNTRVSESKDIIKHYTNLQLITLKKSLQ